VPFVCFVRIIIFPVVTIPPHVYILIDHSVKCACLIIQLSISAESFEETDERFEANAKSIRSGRFLQFSRNAWIGKLL
jgi:hypothetical protein